MAAEEIPAYNRAMVEVTQFSDMQMEMADENAIYVWPGVVQPAWGVLDAFRQRPQVGIRFADEDWKTAIEAAMGDARRAGLPKVYVFRNA